MKKALAILLVIVCLITGTLSGCGIKKAVVKIPLYDGKRAEFIIITSEDADDEVTELAEDFQERIFSKLKISPLIYTDTKKHTEGKMEINIGMTNRPDAKKVYDTLANENASNANDFIVQKHGDIIYVIGMSQDALSLAIDFFINKFCVDNTCAIREDYSFTYNYEYTDKDIYNLGNGISIGDYKIITPKYNMSYIVGKEVIALEEAIFERGYSIPSVTDGEKESKYEIIIDSCNRPGVSKIDDADEYHITEKDNKIFINGGSREATSIAVKQFCDMVKSGKKIDSGTDIKGSYNETAQNYKGLYTATVQDDFDGEHLSDLWNNWTYPSTPEVNKSDDKKTVFNNYRDHRNVTLKDGMLYMKAYIGDTTVENGVTTHNIYSAKMDTTKSFWYRYGYVEFSGKAIKGSGLGSTFWTHGDSKAVGNLYCEFDFPEFYGNSIYYRGCPLAWKVIEENGVVSNKMGVYYGGKEMRGNDIYTLENNEAFSETFHTYGLEWDKDYYRFIVDGRIVKEIKYSAMTEKEVPNGWTKSELISAYRQPTNILVSIKAGAYGWAKIDSDWPGIDFEDRPQPEDIFEKAFDGEDDTLTVDYMVVYQKKGQHSGASAAEVREKSGIN